MDSKPTIGALGAIGAVNQMPTSSSVNMNNNQNIKPWEQKMASTQAKPEAINSNDLDIPSFLRKKNGNKQ